MLNIEVFKNTALYLLENYNQIMYYTFLESVKTESNKVLVESIQNGFRALHEDTGNATSLNEKQVSDIFSGFWKVAKSLPGLVEKLKDEGVNQSLFNIRDKKPGSGKLEVKTFGGGEPGKMNPVTDFTVVPGEPDDSDAAKALAILVSSCIPLVVDLAHKMSKTPEYVEAAKDFIVELLTEELPQKAKEYQFTGVPFFQWFRTVGYKNAWRKAISKASGVAMVSKVWGAGKEYKKGDVVNHAQRNWKAINDISAEENKVSPEQSPNQWEQFGKSKSQEMSTSAGIGATGGDEDAKKEIGEVVKSEQYGTPEETETNVDVKKLLGLLPDGREKQALMMLYGIGTPRMTDQEIADKLGTGRTNVHALVKKAIDMIRAKAKVKVAA